MEEREHRSLMGVLVVVVGGMALYVISFIVISTDLHVGAWLVRNSPRWFLTFLETVYWPLYEVRELLYRLFS